jgi:hypothetical protein
MLSGSMQNHAWPKRHVQEDKKNKGPDRASERPHHSCQFEILRPDSFFSLSLLEISFVLQVPKVYCS